MLVEINGIKMDIDERTATVSDVASYKVGAPVKLLVKEYSSYEVYYGTIVAFDNFNELPTISIAYVSGHSSPEIKMAYINAQSGDKYQMSPALPTDLDLSADNVLRALDRKIEETFIEYNELKRRREYFVQQFGSAFQIPGFENTKQLLDTLTIRDDQ